jgi:4-hydroxyphenylpyruvate dioxygenase
VRSGLDPSRLCTGRGAISGECTGLTSRALSAPCGKTWNPIDESKCEEGSEDMDQIQEFIQQYHGEGIQHVALSTDNILETWDQLHVNGVKFMTPPPDTYYVYCKVSQIVPSTLSPARGA